MTDKATAAAAVAFVLTAAITGHVVIGEVTGEDFQQYLDDSEEWCEERNGTLVNVQAIIHGGLHCDLPNGETVHMSEVVEYGE